MTDLPLPPNPPDPPMGPWGPRADEEDRPLGAPLAGLILFGGIGSGLLFLGALVAVVGGLLWVGGNW
jgi:hypothetical protein